MARSASETEASTRLREIERRLVDRAGELGVFLVYDRPSRVQERPGLRRTFFSQRCVADKLLSQIASAFDDVGAHVEAFDNEPPFLAALAEGRIQSLGRELLVAYNGIGWGIGPGGFRPGRKALIPAVADSYGIMCANSDAYACALTLHKFHCFRLMESLGIRTPPTWHYRPDIGWVGGVPHRDSKVIVKSTYEAWSVGVTDDSVFIVDESCEERVAAITEDIGQPVTVQEFVAGDEVYVPVFSCPERIAVQPVESVLAKAPGDPEAFVTIDDNLHSTAISYRPYEANLETLSQLQSEAVSVFETLQLQGFTRMDFRVDATGQAWVIDVAISPGLENDGSGAVALAGYGFDHAAFVRTVVAATIATQGLLDS